MVWIFFLSTNRNLFQRNQLGASTLGSEPHRHCIYLFQIKSSGTFLTSHISAMLYHIVSEASKFGQFRWSGFFSYQQTGTFFWRNPLRASTLGSEPHGHSIYLFQIESPGTFLTSHISAMLYHIVSEASKFGQFRWSGFFPINKSELFSTQSTTGVHPWIRTA